MSNNTNVTQIRKYTDITELFDAMQGGTFQAQLERALSEVALHVVTHGDKGKKGKVVIEFNMARVGESTQVNLTHKLTFNAPTARGKKSEDAAAQVPLHVGSNGRLSLSPELNNQELPLGARSRD